MLAYVRWLRLRKSRVGEKKKAQSERRYVNIIKIVWRVDNVQILCGETIVCVLDPWLM